MMFAERSIRVWGDAGSYRDWAAREGMPGIRGDWRRVKRKYVAE
ncbi:MAG TPA: hypothetical protein PLI09_18335 [Candidatus Hydrogenedentes bacterium]|nr:hypothetical protein [Candidatus Hydrogenedentota bacterium]